MVPPVEISIWPLAAGVAVTLTSPETECTRQKFPLCAPTVTVPDVATASKLWSIRSASMVPVSVTATSVYAVSARRLPLFDTNETACRGPWVCRSALLLARRMLEVVPGSRTSTVRFPVVRAFLGSGMSRVKLGIPAAWGVSVNSVLVTASARGPWSSGALTVTTAWGRAGSAVTVTVPSGM